MEEESRRVDVVDSTSTTTTPQSTAVTSSFLQSTPTTTITTTSTTLKPAVEESKQMQSSQPSSGPADAPVSQNAPGTITNMSDIVKLVRFVFLRGHIVLDASHRVLMRNESRIERLMDYLHDIQLRRGKNRVLPMDDRDLGCEDIPDSKLHLRELCKAATFDCLSASEMMDMLPKSIAFHQAITRICPLLLFRQSRPICIADAKKLIDVHLNQKIKLVEPSIERVWGFGVLFVTISIIVSMGGLMLLPFLKKSSRTTILTFFEGLAVGGLAGSAILHLFPQAFDIVDDKYRAYFWNTSFIFGGIYLFYFIEMCLKIFKAYYGKNRRKRVPSSGAVYRDGDIYLDAMGSNGRMAGGRLGSNGGMIGGTSKMGGQGRKSSSSSSAASSNSDFLTNCKGGDVYQIKYATSSSSSSSSSESSSEENEEHHRAFRHDLHRSRNSRNKKHNVTPTEVVEQIMVAAVQQQQQLPEMTSPSSTSVVAVVHPAAVTSRRILTRRHSSSPDKQTSEFAQGAAATLSPLPVPVSTNTAAYSTVTSTVKEALISSTREQLAQCLSTVNVIQPPIPTMMMHQQQRNINSSRGIHPGIHRPLKERMVSSVALRRQDHESANTITIDTVAWMIVLGDALLNFIDGLSIGAAFDRNILAGMSISVAVMLEEVCHRLGTFAVLIRAGMSMKQAFVYIFLSACCCYPGLALGIFLGDEAEDASPYIFALAGGFFLYMALVDVMKAMQRTMENASRKNVRMLIQIWALQNLGIVLAAISLALLAFYEKDMDFEEREKEELKNFSFS